MKNVILPLLFTLISLHAYSQSSIIKFNPIPLVNSTLSLGFEQKIASSSSLQFNFDYMGEKDMGFKDTWLGLGAEYRMYNLISALQTASGEAPDGLFVAPTVGIRFFSSVDKDDPDPEFDEKYSFANAGVLIGYQWLPDLKGGKRPLAIEASVGLLGGFMLKGDRFDYEDFMLWPRFNIGFVPTVNVGIGFAFGK